MMRINLPAAACLAVSLAAATGCAYLAGGSMVQDDHFTYESTVYQPQTVTLIDTRTNEVVWTMDIPVGQRLELQFYEDKSEGYADFPDLMRWEVWKDESVQVMKSSIAAPDRWSRRLELTLRKSPEFYPGAQPVVNARE